MLRLTFGLLLLGLVAVSIPQINGALSQILEELHEKLKRNKGSIAAGTVNWRSMSDLSLGNPGSIVNDVSAIPLNENTTELPLQTTNKTITLEDVKNDEGVEAIRTLLSLCLMKDPASKIERKNYENSLKEVMKSKNFSAFYDQFLQDITETRNAECSSGSDPNQFTGTNSENYVLITRRVFGKPEAETSTTEASDGCGPNSFKFNNRCFCKNDSTMINGTCVSVIGKECQSSEDCGAGNDPDCYEGTCQWGQEYEGRMWKLQNNQQ